MAKRTARVITKVVDGNDQIVLEASKNRVGVYLSLTSNGIAFINWGMVVADAFSGFAIVPNQHPTWVSKEMIGETIMLPLHMLGVVIGDIMSVIEVSES